MPLETLQSHPAWAKLRDDEREKVLAAFEQLSEQDRTRLYQALGEAKPEAPPVSSAPAPGLSYTDWKQQMEPLAERGRAEGEALAGETILGMAPALMVGGVAGNAARSGAGMLSQLAQKFGGKVWPMAKGAAAGAAFEMLPVIGSGDPIHGAKLGAMIGAGQHGMGALWKFGKKRALIEKAIGAAGGAKAAPAVAKAAAKAAPTVARAAPEAAASTQLQRNLAIAEAARTARAAKHREWLAQQPPTRQGVPQSPRSMRLNPQADTDAAAARGFEKPLRVTLKELVQPGAKGTMRQVLAEPPAFARNPVRPPLPKGTQAGPKGRSMPAENTTVGAHLPAVPVKAGSGARKELLEITLRELKSAGHRQEYIVDKLSKRFGVSAAEAYRIVRGTR